MMYLYFQTRIPLLNIWGQNDAFGNTSSTIYIDNGEFVIEVLDDVATIYQYSDAPKASSSPFNVTLVVSCNGNTSLLVTVILLHIFFKHLTTLKQ